MNKFNRQKVTTLGEFRKQTEQLPDSMPLFCYGTNGGYQEFNSWEISTRILVKDAPPSMAETIRCFGRRFRLSPDELEVQMPEVPHGALVIEKAPVVFL